MKQIRGQGGYSLIEMIIALFLALIVVIALGRLLLANQNSWESGRDKAELQQNMTESLEWMARSIRTAHSLVVINTSEFRTYDNTGSLTHTYKLVTHGGENRLQVDGHDLVTRRCTDFTVSTDDDTTSLTLRLEIEDDDGDLVAGMTRVAIRNCNLEF